jgi:Fur family peroxide stress response transcriptional regulator
MRAVTATCADVRAIFARRGLRCTKQRVEIFEALRSTKSHPTADELHRLVHEHSPGISLATIYNTLEALHEAGLCQKLSCASGGARYDADVEPHLHVVTDDGRIIDVDATLTREVLDSIPASTLASIERHTGVRIRGVRVELDGVAAPTPA